MSKLTEQAVAALERLPEDLQETMVSRLLEQAERFRALKAAIDDGLRDIEHGRVQEWDFETFIREAQSRR